MNCILRKWQMSDAKDLAATLNNEKILNNLRDGLPFPYTEKDASDYITAMLSADENNTFAYAITIDGRVVGSIGAFRQGNIHRYTAELGYYLAEEYWGQGIATDAIRKICGIIFDTTDIMRIFAEPFSYNAASRRALEKAGFTFEGTLKYNAVKNGKVLDMSLYSLTRSTVAYPVLRLTPEQVPSALELSLNVFMEFEAPVYPPEGVAEFKATLENTERIRRMNFYGAFDNEKLVGVLYMRKPQHIAGFFVDSHYHRRGIGRSLFEAMRRDYSNQVFTVNASPYAVEIYKHLGFVPTDTQQITNGIIYTPMLFEEKK